MTSTEETLRRFARETGGKFSQQKDFWLLRDPAKVVARADDWAVTFESEYDPGRNRIVTRVMAPYSATKEWFGFEIHRGGVFRNLAKALKVIRDIEVGDADFDREFSIEANDESKVRELLANPRIRELIQSIPDINLRGRAWELRLEVPNDKSGVEGLRVFRELFVDTLRQLRQIGAIE